MRGERACGEITRITLFAASAFGNSEKESYSFPPHPASRADTLIYYEQHQATLVFLRLKIPNFVMFALSALSVLLALAANLALMPNVVSGHGMELHNPTDVGFKATFCDPAKPLQEDCDLYLGLVFVNESRLTWGVSESVPNTTISIVDMKSGKEGTLVTLDLADGRIGALNTTDGTSYYSNDTMGVKELASHFCMGHIFAEYENEQYRIDSDSDPAGCEGLLSSGGHSAAAGHDDHSMGDMPMAAPMVSTVASSGVQATVGAAVFALAGLAFLQ